MILAVVVTVGYFIFSKKEDATIRSELVLHVKDTGRVHQVVIVHRDGHQQRFQRDVKGWRDSHGQMIRSDAMKNFLSTVTAQRVSSLIPKAAMENVVKDLSTQSVRIQLLDKGAKDLLTFYVGGVTPDDRGTFMIREGSEIPVIVNIPGFEGGLRTRYIMSDREWQSRELLPELQEVKHFKIDFPQQQEHSFSLTIQDNNQVLVQKLWDVNQQYSEVNRDKLSVYIDRLKNLFAEAILDPEKVPDLSKSTPFCHLEITDNTGKIYTLSFYPKHWVDHAADEMNPGKIDRYYTLSNTGIIFLTQHLLMQRIFIGYEHFVSSLGSEQG